ncbi:MAG: NAD(P)/FAD-dependent oxidoreductase [Ignavibacteriae bacterium]|nr:NAD(P)/FAD-dependent oxidoreductase [Ignavibacteriota bacterium]MCB9216943.1 NAD(P)/FAD-dependent oxidoreductase [Ignavibacteria bacterium]
MSNYDYDVIVIGGGAAGLTASGMASSLGARTLLVEADRPGGDCTWTGCVPSKRLLRIAQTVKEISLGEEVGLHVENFTIDFSKVMESVRSVREEIYAESDSPEALAKHNVEVLKGRASFIDPHRLQVVGTGGERELSARYVVICAGAAPRLLEIEGLQPELIQTSESIFELKALPSRLAIVGGGAIGVELGQAFQRLGSNVTIVEAGESILSNAEPEVAELLADKLRGEGISLLLNQRILSGRAEGDCIQLQLQKNESDRLATEVLESDLLLAAVGRLPNVAGLNLESAGVDYDETGITINHSCQTSTSHIYACGDIAKGSDFTHVAENMAKTAITRILLKIPSTWERSLIPAITYTDPEVAQVGMRMADLKKSGKAFNTIRFPYSHIDRARIEGRGDGMILVHYLPLTGKILGAHIVGAHAGELIHEIALAMRNSLSLREISNTVHAYPSWSQGVRRAADQIYVQTGSAGALKMLGKVFGYRGEVSKIIGTDEVV